VRQKALIVEDDFATRVFLRKLVEAADCQVDEAKDGEEAMVLLAKSDYAVILLDIALPKLSGTDILEHLFATTPAVLEHIIVVTGLNIEEIRELFPTICNALSKPVMPKRLMESIHKCLRTAAHEYLTSH